jgi:CRISPR system Cascade subunit CasB
MQSRDEPQSGLVSALLKIADQGDRAAMATLRRGLSRSPGTVLTMAPFVEPYLAAEASRWDRDASYLVAALFAAHPNHRAGQSLGSAFRRLSAETGSGSIEGRFAGLLDCDAEDLHHHLRHAIRLLGAHDIALDWHRLARDIRHWRHADRWVQRGWARDFWGTDHQEQAPVAAHSVTEN